MSERAKPVADLVEGDRIRLSDPWAIAVVTSNEPRTMKRFNDRGAETGTYEARLIVFRYSDGPRKGAVDHVFANPEQKAVLP